LKYKKYAKQFEDKPTYFANCLRAFISGGIICLMGYFFQAGFMYIGIDETDAATWSTVLLIVIAQVLTGIGCFDVLGKIGGAGVAIPITGFANSVVAPAMEYKAEGPVLGVGSKIFSLAGPVILLGTALSWIVGVIYWIIGIM
jgi:stage V sporulation protein AC